MQDRKGTANDKQYLHTYTHTRVCVYEIWNLVLKKVMLLALFRSHEVIESFSRSHNNFLLHLAVKAFIH